MDVDKLNKYLAPILERPQLKKWLILQLERRKHKDGALFFPATPDKQYIREPVEFREALKEALRPLFKTVVYTKFHDGALWAAIDMLSIGLQHPKITIYLVHYPHAGFVFVSRIKSRSVQLSLHEALCDVFQCDQVRVVNCKGRDLTSLKDMALHPLSQGSFGAYRLYKTLLDSNLFDDEDDHQDRRRRNRAVERADERARHGNTGAAIVSPSKQRRFEVIGGTGAVVDESRARPDLAVTSSGALTKGQREALAAGSSAVNEIKLVVDHDLEWAGKKIPFSCTVVVRGSNIIKGISKLGEKGLVEPNHSVADVVADASNVIRDAFESRDKKNKKQRASAAGSENTMKKMVRTIAVECI